MKRYLLSAMLMLGVAAGAPLMIGCDEEVSHEKKIEVKDDGTVKKEEKKVTEAPDGTVTKTEEKKVDKPASP